MPERTRVLETDSAEVAPDSFVSAAVSGHWSSLARDDDPIALIRPHWCCAVGAGLSLTIGRTIPDGYDLDRHGAYPVAAYKSSG